VMVQLLSCGCRLVHISYFGRGDMILMIMDEMVLPAHLLL
jgi:hypothetical protein